MGILVFGILANCCLSTYFTTNLFVVRFDGKALFSHFNNSFSRATALFLFTGIFLPVFSIGAATTQLGDLNGDGVVDVRDLVILQNHINGVKTLSSNALPLADLNDDGYITQADVTVLANLILGVPVTITPRAVTLDPATGSTQVGVSVRPKAIFPKPIDTSTLNSNNFYATFAGQKLPATIVPSSDGTWAWLFFSPDMPSAAQVQVTVDGSTIQTRLGLLVDAAGSGTPGSANTFNLSTVSVAPLSNTYLVGRIVDPGPDLIPLTSDDYIPDPGGDPTLGHYLLPIQGVQVYILGLETNVVYTDVNGLFSINPAPVGDVKIVVNGLTATTSHPGYYFPQMTLDNTFQPGAMNHLMSDNDTLYLPRVASNILQNVSGTNNTLITLATNAGLHPDQQSVAISDHHSAAEQPDWNEWPANVQRVGGGKRGAAGYRQGHAPTGIIAAHL